MRNRKMLLVSLAAALFFAVPCVAQTTVLPAPSQVSTFSAQTFVASLPAVGQTVAANVSGATLNIAKGFGIDQTDILSGSVQVYTVGPRYTGNMDKLTPATWKNSGWHFQYSAYAEMGVSEYDTQHTAMLAGGDFSAQPPNTATFSLVAGAAYINASGVNGHWLVKLGPKLSW